MKHVVARVGDIPDGGRLLVTVRGRSIGIFNVGGEYYALLNRCPHMGAELCRGSLVGRLEAKAPGELAYDPGSVMVQCPWHGWEYDVRTGESYFDSRVRPYPVAVEDGARVHQEVEEGLAVTTEAEGRGSLTEGLSGVGLQPGPYVAETYDVAVDGEYVVVTLPGRRRA
jgi:nitrite reductase/ring-hydroxylating ferredoxin subunit